MALHLYLPQDRLRALTRNEMLPDRTRGAALFADISGFTALTEGLRNSLGPRRGAEELNKRLEFVYSALISKIEEFGGSVIDFAGDSMMCWFDDAGDRGREIGEEHASASALAVACAFAMQRAMRAFAKVTLPDKSTVALTLKVAIASGDARRFVGGNPQIHLMDALAGATIARTAMGEHLAQKGEIVTDEATANELGEWVTLREWRTDDTSGERFAVLDALTQPIEPPLLSPLDMGYLSEAELHPWLYRALVEREHAGQSAYHTEFRPCVAMFVRFMGINYDADDAGAQLDEFIRAAQDVVAKYDGTFLQITIGDKGSYTYINFGVLTTHEDDARRAVRAAMELRAAASEMEFLEPMQIGITQGTLRVGANGGQTRKAFGAMGDEVNLAARLMTNAQAGEILVSGRLHQQGVEHFVFEPRAPLAMKGKAEPLPVFAVTGERKQRAIRLQEPTYALPMVGRQKELELVDSKLEMTMQGKSQVIGIVAEAGMGKSRLVAEVIRLAHKKGFVGYGGACQQDGITTPYLVWKSIWQAFFDLDHEMPVKKQMRWLEGEIEDRAPTRVQAIPLLNVVLDLQMPENEFTQNLEPKIRQSALHALLEDCLRVEALNQAPLLIVIEDLHWIDAVSHDLLEQLAKALANARVCFVLAYRPPELMRLQAPRLEALPQFSRIELHELNRAEAEQAIRAKLLQLYPARAGGLPRGLVDQLMARAQGNPFYLEELLNYAHDRGLDPSHLESIELPDSLHTLILSRIDQLSEREKTTLRVASIIGRMFRAGWLAGYYPALGQVEHVKLDLDKLDSLDITPLETPEPELQYLFKHIVTHEVTYESLPFTLRAQLHEQLARYLEKQIAARAIDETHLLETLTYHYERTGNQAKQREYLRKAAQAAQKNFSNDAALEYYGKLMSLLKDGKEQTEIHLKRGQVFEFMGMYDEAELDYRAALEFAKEDKASQASAQFALGKLNRLRGDHEPALEWLAQAKQVRVELQDEAGLAQVLIEIGMVLWREGEHAQAGEPLNEGLALARQAGDRLNMALALNNLGNVANFQGDSSAARKLYKESLALRHEIGDKAGIAASLNNLGNVANYQGDYAAARTLLEESLALKREMGDKYGIATSLSNLGNVSYAQGDYVAARTLQEESLAFQREMGDKWGIAMSLSNLGNVAYAQGDYAAARTFQEESLALCREVDDKTIMAYALLGLGLVDLVENKPDAREHILHSLRLRQETGEQLYQTSSLIGVAVLALHKDNPQFAAQLLGADESALKALNAVMEPDVKPFYAQTLAAAREQLGEQAFQAAWEEGSKWTLEEAAGRALRQELPADDER